MHWVYLACAILAEVVGSSALKASDGFSRIVPALLAIGAFIVALFFLSLALRTLPLGVAYAIWAGTGTALLAIIGVTVFGQSIDLPGILGISLVIAGVIVLNVFSTTAQS